MTEAIDIGRPSTVSLVNSFLSVSFSVCFVYSVVRVDKNKHGIHRTHGQKEKARKGRQLDGDILNSNVIAS